MASKKIYIGIIGLQHGSHVHVPAFRLNSETEVVAIAGKNIESCKKIAAKLKIPSIFRDWRDLVASPQVDAISIAVPPDLQPLIICEAVRLKKPVFCEKPLASNIYDAEKIWVAVEKANIPHAINFIFPEVASWQSVRNLIISGKIGPLKHFSYSWRTQTYSSRYNIDSWKNNVKRGGGVIGNFLSHVIYNIEWLLGDISYLKPTFLGKNISYEKFCSGAVGLTEGAHGVYSISTDAYLGSHRIEIYGNQGTILLQNCTSDYVNGFEAYYGSRASGKLEIISPVNAANKIDGRILASASIMHRFLQAIRVGGIVKPNLQDGLKIQHWLQQISVEKN